jgi:hypothetical protein
VTEATMKQVNLRKELKHLYDPSAKEVVEVEVPEMRFLMVDGQGVPPLPRPTKKRSKRSTPSPTL